MMKNIYFLFIFKLFSRFVGIPKDVQNSWNSNSFLGENLTSILISFQKPRLNKFDMF